MTHNPRINPSIVIGLGNDGTEVAFQKQKTAGQYVDEGNMQRQTAHSVIVVKIVVGTPYDVSSFDLSFTYELCHSDSHMFLTFDEFTNNRMYSLSPQIGALAQEE